MDKDLIEYLDKKFDKIDDINERLIKIESNDLSHLLTIDKFDEFVIKDFADVKVDIAELKTIKRYVIPLISIFITIASLIVAILSYLR